MKQKRINRLLMLLVAFLTVSVTQVWAVTFKASDFSGGTSGTGSQMSKTLEGVSVSTDKGYATTQFRVYSGGKLTISSSIGNISGISFTFSGTNNGGMSANYENVNSDSWSFTTTSQARITEIEVTIASAPAVAYSVTLNMDGAQYGTVLTEASAGAGVTLPSLDDCGDYNFEGWSKTNTNETSTQPTIIKSGSFSPSANETLYAVFSKITSSSLTVTGSNLSGTTTATKLNANHPITYKLSASNTYSNPLRVYSNNIVTIAGGTMSRIVFTVASGYDATKLILQSGGGSISNGVWTGSSSSVQVKANGEQVRVSSISVTYGETTTTYTSSPRCAPTTYTASIVAPVNGSIKLSTDGTNWGTSALEGLESSDEFYFQVTPNDGYEIGTLTVTDGADKTYVLNTDYEWNAEKNVYYMLVDDADIVISATFREIPSAAILAFDANGKTLTNSLPANIEDVTVDAAFSLSGVGSVAATGYTFVGWNTDNTANVGLNEVTPSAAGTLTLYAIWTTNHHSVTYVMNGGTGCEDIAEQDYSTNVTVCANPEKEHAQFDGWTSEDVTIVDGQFTMPDKDVTITANWTPKHQVKWSVNGQVTSEWVAEGAAITFPAKNEVTGVPDDYEFMGWYDRTYTHATDAPTYVTEATMGNENVTYFAVFAQGKKGETTYTKLASNSFVSGAEYVLAAEESSTSTTLHYFSSYTGTSSNESWGVTSTTVADAIIFKLSGTADALVAKDASNNYIQALTTGRFKMSSSSTTLKLNNDGKISNPSSTTYYMRYNHNNGSGGFRWYDGNTGTSAYFYKKDDGTTYSNYCTSVKSVTSVAVKTAGKVLYKVGETFDASDYTLTVSYDDESSEEITSDFTANLTEVLTTENTSVALSYKGQSCQKAINVVALDHIAVTTAPTKTAYTAGDAFDANGMVVKATWGTTAPNVIEEEVTAAVTVTDGTSLTKEQTSVTLSYTHEGTTKTTTQDITVKALVSIDISSTPDKTAYYVGDAFDPAGLVVTGTYNVGDPEVITEGITWNLPDVFEFGQNSVTITATVGGVTSAEFNVTGLTISKKNASIEVANITNLEVGGNKTPEATTTPADATLTYTIKNGNDYISIENGVIKGLAVGTATVRADYEGNDTYEAANTTFTVNVIPASVTVTQTGFSSLDANMIDDINGEDTNLSYIAEQGDAANAPALNPNSSTYIRLYQNGGKITIKGVKGVHISSASLTTGSTYATTTIAHVADPNDDTDTPETGTSVAKESTYTASNLDCNSIAFYCLGTDKNTRVDVAALRVKYTKEVVELSSIALSGTYDTKFVQNGSFNHEGVVVTATYSDGDTQDVTPSAEFSAPDMATTGTKTITVSYTEGDVTKTATYDITVVAEEVTAINLSGEYQKIFKTDDEFNHTGLVIKADYNSGRKDVDVRNEAVVSTPDMSTSGEKSVTVSFGGQSKTYEIKVIPAGAIFYESFDLCDGTGGNDGQWSGSIASSTLTTDNNTTGNKWSFTNSGGANKCAKFGTGSNKGAATTPKLGYAGTAILTFKSAAWNSKDETCVVNLSIVGDGTISKSSITNKKGEWTTYTVILTDLTENSQIKFEAAQNSNNRFFLDEVLVEGGLTAHVSSFGWASLSVPQNAIVPDGVEVFGAVLSDDNSYVRLIEFNGTILNKDEGYVIKATEGNHVFGYTEEDVPMMHLNALKPVHVETLVSSLNDGKIYTLGRQNGAVCFGTPAGETIKANRSYLEMPAGGASSIGVRIEPFSPIATGLENQKNNDEACKKLVDGRIVILRANRMYDLNGRLIK